MRKKLAECIALATTIFFAACSEAPKGYGDTSPEGTAKCIRAANLPNGNFVYECPVFGDVKCYTIGSSQSGIDCVYFPGGRN